jgi:diaminohydroxyphosphoribosylaminopyrimidine deaminase/5-amino-6-(5-phosphoribosylamino)uracil reductase
MRHALDNTVDGIDVETAMRAALELARATRPHPNPRVGAVIVDPHGAVVAEGAHTGPGNPHAEVEALADQSFGGHTMVVTLEPCNHTGRTPPCTDAIIASGIERVVVGAIDPDHRVAGRGIERLRSAGIEVTTGVLADEVERTDRAYFHHRRTGRAFVTLKMAATLDGQAAAADGTSQWITGAAAREDVHRTRSEHDAVLVGAGTYLTDHPDLSVRDIEYDGPQPRPVVVAGRRAVHLTDDHRRRGGIVIRSGPLADPLHIATELPNSGILSVLVEGGPALARSFLDAGIVDEIHWYLGAVLGGGTGTPVIGGRFDTLADAVELRIDRVEVLGGDLKVVANVGSR